MSTTPTVAQDELVSTRQSFKAALESAAMPERIVSICFRGDLLAEIQQREAELREALEAEARETGDQRMGSQKKSRPLADAIEKLRAQMRAASVDVRVRALKSSRWRALKREHPLKESDEESYTKLMTAALPESIIEPQDARDDIPALADALTEGQWDDLCRAVVELNEEGVSVPFSRLASVAMQPNDDD